MPTKGPKHWWSIKHLLHTMCPHTESLECTFWLVCLSKHDNNHILSPPLKQNISVQVAGLRPCLWSALRTVCWIQQVSTWSGKVIGTIYYKKVIHVVDHWTSFHHKTYPHYAMYITVHLETQSANVSVFIKGYILFWKRKGNSYTPTTRWYLLSV